MANFKELAKLLQLQQAQAGEDVYKPIPDKELEKIAPSLFEKGTYQPPSESELQKIAPHIFRPPEKDYQAPQDLDEVLKTLNKSYDRMKGMKERPVPPYQEDENQKLEGISPEGLLPQPKPLEDDKIKEISRRVAEERLKNMK